jgi:hypothetical protein
VPPSPETLARGYLSRAGYDAETIVAVAPLVQQAEEHLVVEKQLGPIRTN